LASSIFKIDLRKVHSTMLAKTTFLRKSRLTLTVEITLPTTTLGNQDTEINRFNIIMLLITREQTIITESDDKAYF
jgi:hypothetical protein